MTNVDNHGTPKEIVGEPPVTYTDFDDDYRAVDRHGMPGGYATPPVTHTDFDDDYRAVDRHGMPGGYATPPVTHTDFDEAYKAVDRHGMPGGYAAPPVTHTDFDDAYRAVDRHGMPGGYAAPPVTYTDFDDGYKAVDRHGIPGGWINPDKDEFQTDDSAIIQFCNDIIDADQINENGYAELANLTEGQIKKIIEKRYLKTATKLVNKDTSDIEKQIYLDLNIITKMIIAKKNLYDKDINISYLIGENYGDITDLLSAYENLISNSFIDNKEELLETIRNLKESAKSYNNQLNNNSPKK